VEGSSASRPASAKIEPRIADTPRPAPDTSDPSGGLGEVIDRITMIEDPAAVEQREENLDRLRGEARGEPQGPYGQEQPFLDYLLGNDE
jgi:hypothetical protein